MPVEGGGEFSQAILKEAKQEAEEILDLARREAERIIDGARAELDQVYKQEEPQAATQKVKTRFNQIVAAAEFEARKQELLMQERLIAEVQTKVQERLLQIRDAAEYPEILVGLITEGVSELNGEEFEIIVAPEDQERITEDMLETLRTKTGKILTRSEQTRTGVTGAIVQRLDKRVVCDNTFQGIFERRQDEMRALIAQDLFGEIEET
jgi:vacuolar-type H+-ATPase subunit E/Vma4